MLICKVSLNMAYPEWLLVCQFGPRDRANASLIYYSGRGRCNVLESVCPKSATPKELPASPGEFVPIMKTILKNYEADLVGNQAKLSPSAQLPRLFSLCPVPSFNWKSIAINAQVLGNFFPSV
jgi:hypothetical protein